MEGASQVVLRNRDALAAGAVLLVNPPRDGLFRELRSDHQRIRVSTQDFGDFRWLAASGADAMFEAAPAARPGENTVVLFLPREKQRLTLLLHAIAATMPPVGRLLLIGENRAGIKSSARHLESFFGDVDKLDSARHCSLFKASGPAAVEPFALDDYAQTWTAEVGGARISVHSLPGVFAHGRLDDGSRLLLESLQRLGPRGRVLDFAAGSGVIGCALLATRNDIDLTLLDVYGPAIESARRTLAANALTATLVASDGLSELEGRFDWIVSNPPFHRGVASDLDTAARFFRDAGTFLEDDGRIVIVCNRHLPYRKWLQASFDRVAGLEQNNEFTIMLAERPVGRKE